MFNLNPGPALIGAAAIFAAGIGAATFTPLVGANARVAREVSRTDVARKAVTVWRDSSAAQAKAAADCKGLRGHEAETARQAVAADAAACDARVTRARTQGAALQAILTQETSRDPKNPGARRLVDAGRLRDALGVSAAAPGGAARTSPP